MAELSRSHVSFLSHVLCLMSNPRSVSFSVPHTFSLPSCPPVLPLLSLSAQADRKCQVRPGYFRPNWEIDVPLETWHLDMPFILPHALPPKRREPDMMTARWNTDNCPFLRTFFSANQRQAWHRSEKKSSGGESKLVRRSLILLVLTTFISHDAIAPELSVTVAIERLKGGEYTWMGWKNRGIGPS